MICHRIAQNLVICVADHVLIIGGISSNQNKSFLIWLVLVKVPERGLCTYCGKPHPFHHCHINMKVKEMCESESDMKVTGRQAMTYLVGEVLNLALTFSGADPKLTAISQCTAWYVNAIFDSAILCVKYCLWKLNAGWKCLMFSLLLWC